MAKCAGLSLAPALSTADRSFKVSDSAEDCNEFASIFFGIPDGGTDI